MLLGSTDKSLAALPRRQKVSAMSQLMCKWIEVLIEEPKEESNLSEIGGDSVNVMANSSNNADVEKAEQKRKVNKAISNLFQAVEETLANPEGEVDDSPEFLDFFFKACDKLMAEEKSLENQMEEGMAPKDTLTNQLFTLAGAMNHLVSAIKPNHYLIGDKDLMKLAEGYLQNVFLILYEFTEMDPSSWVGRLEAMDYPSLCLPHHIDFFFSNVRLTNLMSLDDTAFYSKFNRFYICVLGILLKGEYVQSTDQILWRFLIDMYSVHFSLSKSVRVSQLCRQTLMSVPDLTAENILLRYAALVKSLPAGYLIASKIQEALKFNYAQVSKVYQNAVLYSEAAITQIHSAIVKEVFLTLFDLIDKRYGNDGEQRAVLELCSSWMKILSFYINYSIHFGNRQKSIAKTFGKFKKDFQHILHMIWSRKIGKENRYTADALYQLTLSATDGIQIALDSCGIIKIKKPVKKSKATLEVRQDFDDAKSLYSMYSEQRNEDSFEELETDPAKFPGLQPDAPQPNVPTTDTVSTVRQSGNHPSPQKSKVKLAQIVTRSDEKQKPSKFQSSAGKV